LRAEIFGENDLRCGWHGMADYTFGSIRPDLTVDNFALHQWKLHPQSECQGLRASSYRLIISCFQLIN
jgi:hypothetical protein